MRTQFSRIGYIITGSKSIYKRSRYFDWHERTLSMATSKRSFALWLDKISRPAIFVAWALEHQPTQAQLRLHLFSSSTQQQNDLTLPEKVVNYTQRLNEAEKRKKKFMVPYRSPSHPGCDQKLRPTPSSCFSWRQPHRPSRTNKER